MTSLQIRVMNQWDDVVARAEQQGVGLEQPKKLIAFLTKFFDTSPAQIYTLRRIREYFILARGMEVSEIAPYNSGELLDRISPKTTVKLRPATWAETTEGMTNETLLRDMKRTHSMSANKRREYLNTASIAQATAISPARTDHLIRKHIEWTKQEWDDINKIRAKVVPYRPPKGPGSLKERRAFSVDVYYMLTLAFGSKPQEQK